jgi:hypothetical protein
MGTKIASNAHRDGVAERFPDPAVQQSIAVALALIGHSDDLLRDLELAMVTTAKQHAAHTLSWLQTVPGISKRLRLVLLYAIHDVARFPRVHDVVSSGRVVQCATESAGKRSGTSGPKMGNAYLTWASPKRRSCSSGTSLRGKSLWPAERKNMARARLEPSWRISWPGPSII